MKAFYLIHAIMILEVILTILAVLKLYEVILKIKKTEKKIKSKSILKAQEIRSCREKIKNFNEKFEEKLNYVHDFSFITDFIKKIAVQGLLKKFVFPKNTFFAKILSYKTTIFWFLVSFILFRNKRA